jgi:hypothetical protein
MTLIDSLSGSLNCPIFSFKILADCRKSLSFAYEWINHTESMRCQLERTVPQFSYLFTDDRIPSDY